MSEIFKNFEAGYRVFKEKYQTFLPTLSKNQDPKIMVISCCDSRVDPALILQCDPGDLFIVRNVASIVPPYEIDQGHHGTSAALEFGIKFLKIKNLVLLGHSNCAGIRALIHGDIGKNDFISKWVSLVNADACDCVEDGVKIALNQSYNNCMGFPWIKEAVDRNELKISRWFFDIEKIELSVFDSKSDNYLAY
jgi:carbonic anhydrase